MFGETTGGMVVLDVSLGGDEVLGETRAGDSCLGSLSIVPDPRSQLWLPSLLGESRVRG